MSDIAKLTTAPPVSSAAKPAAAEARAQAAREFEEVFLAEMLKHAGLGKTSAFGGGIGEDQFQSFLVTQQAKAMTEAGGIGLARVIEAALEARDGK